MLKSEIPGRDRAAQYIAIETKFRNNEITIAEFETMAKKIGYLDEAQRCWKLLIFGIKIGN